MQGRQLRWLFVSELIHTISYFLGSKLTFAYASPRSGMCVCGKLWGCPSPMLSFLPGKLISVDRRLVREFPGPN